MSRGGGVDVKLKACVDCDRPSPRTRCDRCQRLENQRRGSADQRGYDSRWRALVAEAKRLQPWCSGCGTPGTKDNPLTGEHRRWPAETVDDIEVLCRVCNSKRGPIRTGVIPPR